MQLVDSDMAMRRIIDIRGEPYKHAAADVLSIGGEQLAANAGRHVLLA
jgi:hypothetical protein